MPASPTACLSRSAKACQIGSDNSAGKDDKSASDNFVYLKKGDSFVKQSVDAGIADGLLVEIRKGLSDRKRQLRRQRRQERFRQFCLSEKGRQLCEAECRCRHRRRLACRDPQRPVRSEATTPPAKTTRALQTILFI